MKIGIDLGTKNSLVFIPGKGIVLDEPSVVAVLMSENKILAVGSQAKEMIGRTPDAITVFRPLRDGVIANSKITQAMIKYFITKVNKGFSRFIKSDLLIGVPAGISSTEKEPLFNQVLRPEQKMFLWQKNLFCPLLVPAFLLTYLLGI